MPKKTYFKDSSSESDSAEGDNECDFGNDENESDIDEVTVEDAEESSDSDAAPDDVAFTNSRKSALQHIRDIMAQNSQNKLKLKHKRKQTEEKYAEQKKRKLEMLAKNHLPDAILESLSSKEENQSVKPKVEGLALLDTADSGCDDEEGSETEQHMPTSLDEDFIPFDKDDTCAGLHVVALREALKKPKSSAEAAAEFRQNMLYGSRVQRETVKEALGRKAKRKSRFM